MLDLQFKILFWYYCIRALRPKDEEAFDEHVPIKDSERCITVSRIFFLSFLPNWGKIFPVTAKTISSINVLAGTNSVICIGVRSPPPLWVVNISTSSQVQCPSVIPILTPADALYNRSQLTLLMWRYSPCRLIPTHYYYNYCYYCYYYYKRCSSDLVTYYCWRYIIWETWKKFVRRDRLRHSLHVRRSAQSRIDALSFCYFQICKCRDCNYVILTHYWGETCYHESRACRVRPT